MSKKCHVKEKLTALKDNKTLLSGALFSTFSFFSQGMSFILLIILARYILPSDYGNLSLFNNLVLILTYFMAFSSQGYLSVSYFKQSKAEFGKDLSASLFLGLCSFLIYVLIIVVFGGLLQRPLGFSRSTLFMAAIIPFGGLFLEIVLNVYRMKENLKVYGVISCGNALLNFILSLVLVIALAQNWFGRAEANLICSALFGIASLIILCRLGLVNLNIDFKRVKALAKWGIPLIPHSCALWIRSGLDQYIIKYHYTINEVGIFSFALNLASIIITVGCAFNATNSVSIYKTLADNDLTASEKKRKLWSQTKEILYIIVLAYFAVVGGMILLVNFFLPNYKPSIPYFSILSLYGFVQCLYLLVCNYMFYYGKTKEIMYITLGTSILHLILSLLLTRYSLYITAIIYVFIQVVIFTLVYRQSYSLIKRNVV